MSLTNSSVKNRAVECWISLLIFLLFRAGLLVPKLILYSYSDHRAKFVSEPDHSTD